jgi:futalosine hydrolase
MKIVVASATLQEVEPLREYLTERIYLKNHHRITCLVTGVGLMNSTHALTRHIVLEKPDLAIQAGIAGSFSPLFPPESVVVVKEECVADLGVTENNVWKDIYDLGIADADFPPLISKKLVNPHSALLEKLKVRQVRAVSVNEITTSPARTQTYISKYAPVIETMEGAAFHKVCLEEQIPFIQIRAVSNFVGERDKAHWKLGEAIHRLNEQVIVLINKIAEYHQI